MRQARRASLALASGLALLMPACTLATAIDVCDRHGPAEHDVNQRTEGDQALDVESVAAIAGQGAMLALTSTNAAGHAELRIARLDADGTSLPTCEMDGEPTIPWTRPDTIGLDGAAVAFPPLAGDQGLVVFRERTPTQQRLWAIPLSENGCPNSFGTTPPLLVADPGPGVFLGLAHVVAAAQRHFVVSWNEIERSGSTPIASRLLGRVVSTTAPLSFLETRRAPDGSAAALPPDGDLPSNHTLIAMEDGHFALLWYETSVSRFRVRIAVLDDRFAVVAGPTLLAEEAVTLLDAPSSIAGAYDGQQLLAAWTLPEGGVAGHAFASFVDTAAGLLSSERSPDGEPFRLGSIPEGGTETDLSVTGLAAGGFLVAWTERDVTGRTDPSGTGIRALGLDARGRVLFANRACERTDFPLALSYEGDQTRPSLATLGDGTLLFLYTNAGGASNDRSGTGVRGVGLRMPDLFPR